MVIKRIIERLLLESRPENPLPIRIQHTHCEWEEAIKVESNKVLWLCRGPDQVGCSIHERGDEMGDDGTPLFTEMFVLSFNHTETSLVLDVPDSALSRKMMPYLSLVIDRLVGDKQEILMQVPYNKQTHNYQWLLRELVCPGGKKYHKEGEGIITTEFPYATKVSYRFKL